MNACSTCQSSRRHAVPAVLVTALLCLASSTVRGELLVYEPFDYRDGTVLNELTAPNGLNLTGVFEALGPLEFQKLSASEPGLGYGNLLGAPSARGNRANDPLGVTPSGATATLDEEIPIGEGDSIYFSALFTLDDSENGNHLARITLTDDASGDAISFGEAAVGLRAIRIEADTAATGGLVAEGEDLAFEDGQTLLLIGRYFNSAAALGDRLELVGYDTADAIPLAAAFDPGDPNALFSYGLVDRDLDFERITSVSFTIRGENNNFIDELRIGTTYTSVAAVPEAGTLGLFIAATLVAAGSFGRQRRTNH